MAGSEEVKLAIPTRYEWLTMLKSELAIAVESSKRWGLAGCRSGNEGEPLWRVTSRLKWFEVESLRLQINQAENGAFLALSNIVEAPCPHVCG